MWSANSDPGRQLLELDFSGRVTADEARACSARVQELLPQLSPGFTLLTDLSEVEDMDLSCEPIIDKVMDTLNAHGVHKVVRIVPAPEKDIGFGIMSLFHYSPRVRVVTCETVAEAQSHLPSVTR